MKEITFKGKLGKVLERQGRLGSSMTHIKLEPLKEEKIFYILKVGFLYSELIFSH